MDNEEYKTDIHGFIGNANECYLCKSKSNLQKVTIGYFQTKDGIRIPHDFAMLCKDCNMASVYSYFVKVFTESKPNDLVQWFDENFIAVIADLWIDEVFIVKPVNQITMEDLYLLDEYKRIIAYKLRNDAKAIEELKMIEEMRIRMFAGIDENKIREQILIEHINNAIEIKKQSKEDPTITDVKKIILSVLQEHSITVKEFKTYLFKQLVT